MDELYRDIDNRIDAINDQLWELADERRRLAKLKTLVHDQEQLAQLGRDTLAIQTGVKL